MSEYLLKNSETTLTHNFDWAEMLSGETISTDLGWTVHPDTEAAETLAIGATSSTATTTTAQISGGLPGNAYLISSSIQTENGRDIRRSILLRIANV